MTKVSEREDEGYVHAIKDTDVLPECLS